MNCMHRGCPSEATHALKIVVPDQATDRTSAECVLSLELCLAHVESAKASDFFDAEDQLKQLLLADAAQGTEPDFPEAYTEAVPLGSPEHRAYLSLNRRPH